MSNEHRNNSLESPRQSRLASYVEKFGFPFPRPQIVKMASSFGIMDLLEEILQERVDANKPVEDWNDFALELRKRSGQKHKEA